VAAGVGGADAGGETVGELLGEVGEARAVEGGVVVVAGGEVGDADGFDRGELEAGEVLEGGGRAFAPASRSSAASGVPSTRISPAPGRYIPRSSFASVVLPEPFSPTKATVLPAGRSKSRSRRTSTSVPG
jgi:hypothetical protein